jgi:hypothetical protein
MRSGYLIHAPFKRLFEIGLIKSSLLLTMSYISVQENKA